MAARLLLGVYAVLMGIAIANATSGEPASVVIGLAKCADCTRKSMNAESVFKGAFSVPLASDVNSADCHAQLHSAAGKPCPGQEPSTIVPQSEGTFVAVPGKRHYQSAECASATICGPIKKHIIDHFHKKPVPPKPKPEPKPEYHPPQPEYHHPTPTYGGSPTPIYHPPALKVSDTFCGKIKKHIIDHFHKKPVPPKPKPEPKPEYHPPQPEYHHPTPTYGRSSTPIYHPPALKVSDSFGGKIKKHIIDHFHKKSVPPKPEPEPKPEYHPPKPEYHPPMPEYHHPTPSYGGSPTPIYHPLMLKASDTFCGKIKKHIIDHFHKKPVPPKPKPEPMPPKPKPEPMPEYHHPTPTYGGSPTPIYHPPMKH
ncbi:hypothetical protein PR202_gb07723 [Eleusine coracana subsp. coracana]|uniref:Proline-rich protein n=1 Tax=Eleusine coracana subsp. coracana TaxID=191504 RepID=A0AAV5EAE9_ELECO|nr:hypothetical protein PR202_gb07723 [Eleusine coracana subsp. coracana]